jgi:glutathione S-transferase
MIKFLSLALYVTTVLAGFSVMAPVNFLRQQLQSWRRRRRRRVTQGELQEKQEEVTIVSMPYSHFCEKVFFTLDNAGIRYTEIAAGPFLMHMYVAYYSRWLPWASPAAGSQIRQSGSKQSTMTVPLVIISQSVNTFEETERIIPDSTLALRHLAGYRTELDFLYPAAMKEEIELFEADLSATYGTKAFRMVYRYLFLTEQGDELMRKKVFANHLPNWQQFLLPFYYPAVKFIMSTMMQLSKDEVLAEMRAVVDRYFALVEEKLKDGRRYLFKTDQPSAADITFAALTYPIVLPDFKSDRFITYSDDLHPSHRLLVDHYRSTVAGKFVLRIYEEDRRKIL